MSKPRFYCWKCGIQFGNPDYLQSVPGRDGTFCNACCEEITVEHKPHFPDDSKPDSHYFPDQQPMPTTENGIPTLGVDCPDPPPWIRAAAEEIVDWVGDNHSAFHDEHEPTNQIAAIIARHWKS